MRRAEEKRREEKKMEGRMKMIVKMESNVVKKGIETKTAHTGGWN